MKRVLSISITIILLVFTLASCVQEDDSFSLAHSEASEYSGATNKVDANNSTDAKEMNDLNKDSPKLTELTNSPFEVTECTPPENAIYNTTDIASKEKYIDTARLKISEFCNNADIYVFSDFAAGNSDCNLKKLIEQEEVGSDNWFYVAIAFEYSGGVWETGFPYADRMTLIDTINSKLVDYGMIPDYTHPWNYRTLKSEYLFDYLRYNITGYMTADMIKSLNIENCRFMIVHLVSPDEYHEFNSNIIQQ